MESEISPKMRCKRLVKINIPSASVYRCRRRKRRCRSRRQTKTHIYVNELFTQCYWCCSSASRSKGFSWQKCFRIRCQLSFSAYPISICLHQLSQFTMEKYYGNWNRVQKNIQIFRIVCHSSFSTPPIPSVYFLFSPCSPALSRTPRLFSGWAPSLSLTPSKLSSAWETLVNLEGFLSKISYF